MNVASIVAYNTILGGIYSGTKAYVVNFTEALENELQGTRRQGAGRAARAGQDGVLGSCRC